MGASIKLLIGIVAIGILVFAVPKMLGNVTSISGKYDDFAKCLADSKATMYGAYWCTHCQNQKKLFGSSVKYINYVECDQRGDNARPELCKSKGIEGYPTWEFPDGTFSSGEQSLQRLSEKSGCELP